MNNVEFFFVWQKGELHKRLTGCDPNEVKKQLDAYVSMPAVAVPAQKETAQGEVSTERLKELINQRRIMVFMKVITYFSVLLSASWFSCRTLRIGSVVLKVRFSSLLYEKEMQIVKFTLYFCDLGLA